MLLFKMYVQSYDIERMVYDRSIERNKLFVEVVLLLIDFELDFELELKVKVVVEPLLPPVLLLLVLLLQFCVFVSVLLRRLVLTPPPSPSPPSRQEK